MEATAVKTRKDEIAAIRATIDDYFAEMKRLNEDTARQREISRLLSIKTRATLDQIKAKLGHVEPAS